MNIQGSTGKAQQGSGADFSLSAYTPVKRRKLFAPPTVGEVAGYAKAEGLPNHAEYFFDYFSSNGWLIGNRAPMKDWRAAYRNWCRRAPAFGAHGGQTSPSAEVAQYAAEYREACKRGDDAAKRDVIRLAREDGIEWPELRAEIVRLNAAEQEAYAAPDSGVTA